VHAVGTVLSRGSAHGYQSTSWEYCPHRPVLALQELEAHFHADSTAGAAVLALYYFPLGISSLAWGPACDVWGRKPIYLASTALFSAASFGCIFAQSMQMLLPFRALQGMARE